MHPHRSFAPEIHPPNNRAAAGADRGRGTGRSGRAQQRLTWPWEMRDGDLRTRCEWCLGRMVERSGEGAEEIKRGGFR